MSRPTKAVINLTALQHNVNQVKRIAPHSHIMAMVKANAYGHGLSICHHLAAADALGVACLEEALALRHLGERRRIVLLQGFFTAAEFAEIVRYQLEPVLHHQWQIDCLLRQRLSQPLTVWLKVDTGMHRLGFAPHNIAAIYQCLAEQSLITTNVMSHLAEANERHDIYVKQQYAIFSKITARLGGETSLANSAATLAYPMTHLDWVRPGIMLYGISPFAGKAATELNLRPVMQLQSRIIAINEHQAGERIGYGGHYCCSQKTRVAVIPVGYGDGYPREITDVTPVLIRGQRCPIIGRVSMDMMSIDVTSLETVSIDDQVILWGEGLPVEQIAQASNTIAYTLVCGVTRRVHFEYFLS